MPQISTATGVSGGVVPPRLEHSILGAPRTNTHACPCRGCGQPVQIHEANCPHCNLRPPFFCSQCGRSVGPISLMQSASAQNPHGSFSEDGQPLCYLHRLTRCYSCGEHFPQQDMSYLVTGTKADYNLRPQGGPPRVEEVLEMVCPCCASKPEAAAKSASLQPLWWVVAGIAACLIPVLLRFLH